MAENEPLPPGSEPVRAPMTPFLHGGGGVERLRDQAMLSIFICANRGAAVAGDAVLVHGGVDMGPGYNDILFCLDRATGRQRWQFGSRKSSFDYLSPVACGYGRVFVGRNDGLFYALEATDGSVAWTLAHGTAMAIPCLVAGRLVVADASGRLLEVDPRGGAVGREVRVGEGLAAPESDGDTLWLSHLAGGVSALDPTTLRARWTRRLDGPLTCASVPAGPVVLACPAGRIVALGRADGAPAWDLRGMNEAFLPPATAADAGGRAGQVWAAAKSGTILACDLASGRVRLTGNLPGEQSGTREQVCSLALAGGRVLVDTHRGVVAVDPGTGVMQETLAAPGEPWLGPVAVEGANVFVQRVVEYRRVLHCLPLARGAAAWSSEIGAWGLT